MVTPVFPQPPPAPAPNVRSYAYVFKKEGNVWHQTWCLLRQLLFLLHFWKMKHLHTGILAASSFVLQIRKKPIRGVCWHGEDAICRHCTHTSVHKVRQHSRAAWHANACKHLASTAPPWHLHAIIICHIGSPPVVSS